MATTSCEYVSDNPDVNQVESIYEFCMELDEEQAKQDLTKVIKLLTLYVEK